jgi:hypothetical protein
VAYSLQVIKMLRRSFSSVVYFFLASVSFHEYSVVSNRDAFLNKNGAQLIITGVHADVKWFVVVWVYLSMQS